MYNHSIATALQRGREHQRGLGEPCAWVMQQNGNTQRLIAVQAYGCSVVAEVICEVPAEYRHELVMVAKCLVDESGLSAKEYNRLKKLYEQPAKNARVRGVAFVKGVGTHELIEEDGEAIPGAKPPTPSVEPKRVIH